MDCCSESKINPRYFLFFADSNSDFFKFIVKPRDDSKLT